MIRLSVYLSPKILSVRQVRDTKFGLKVYVYQSKMGFFVCFSSMYLSVYVAFSVVNCKSFSLIWDEGYFTVDYTRL